MDALTTPSGTRLRRWALAAVLALMVLLGCGDDAPGYDPCEGVGCGETCQLCDPDDPDCEETSVVKLCNSDEICSAQPTTCQQATDNRRPTTDDRRPTTDDR